VLAILESNAYLICTPNRGGLRGESILVGKDEVSFIADFAPSPVPKKGKAIEALTQKVSVTGVAGVLLYQAWDEDPCRILNECWSTVDPALPPLEPRALTPRP